jgi:hypothetical protein
MRKSLLVSRFVSEALQDFRWAFRRLRRAPTLGVAIILTLGLGLGAAAAVLTMCQAALIDPLPFAKSDRLVHIWEARAGTEERSGTSYATLRDWRARADTFSGLEGYNGSNVTIAIGEDARMLRGAEVTAGFFRLLGVPMATGRDFVQGEDDPPGARVVVVSDGVAQSIAGDMRSIRPSRLTGPLRDCGRAAERVSIRDPAGRGHLDSIDVRSDDARGSIAASARCRRAGSGGCFAEGCGRAAFSGDE